ncbi:MAG: ATP-binding protein [Nitrospirales bacterium]
MALSSDQRHLLPEHVIKVLLVEDDKDDFVFIRNAFAEIPGTCFWLEWVKTCDAGIGLIASDSHDLYFIDYLLGSHTALELLTVSHSLGCEPVLVMLTGEEDREIDLQAIRCGASDYVLKPTLSGVGLDRTIRYALERKRLRLERDNVTAQLVQASHRIGMADVASSVLHNVGNVLNSINVSASVVSATIRHSSLGNITRMASMLEEHRADVGAFLTQDPKGKLIPQYLSDLGNQLSLERTTLLKEVEQLTHHVEHIKQIIVAQQGLARAGGVVERTNLVEVIEQAMALALSPANYEQIDIIRRYQEVPSLQVDKHQVLQILINLIRNAIDAMKVNTENASVLTIGLVSEEGETSRVKITIRDTGAGISPDHLSRLFTQGFTTKNNGHGFGLHSAAISAKSMKGTLSVQSEGEGRGATFTLDLPRRQEGVLV